MDGILHWVWMLAGKPSHFFSESITTDLIFNTLTRISMDKAFSLSLSISPVMDYSNYCERKGFRELVLLSRWFFPQPDECFSPTEKLEITRRSLILLVSTPMMRWVRNYQQKQNPGTMLFFCELVKCATSLHSTDSSAGIWNLVNRKWLNRFLCCFLTTSQSPPSWGFDVSHKSSIGPGDALL